MSLSSKLDRLRGQANKHDSGASGARLGQARPARRGPLYAQTRDAALAEALGADAVGDGLVVRSREYPLPPADADSRDLCRLPEVCGLTQPDWVYIDIETTGLSGGTGNLAFMIGLARYTGEQRLEVRQYVLAGFAAESRMLRELFDWVGPNAVLVSYNGKCFDVPLLAVRLKMHRIDVDPGLLRHLDLMYGVRRAYRGHWPDCRLQTAEKRLLDLHRKDDLPGSEAPAAWQAWLRISATSQLVRVTAHNHQDVVSLALLHRRLLSDYAGSGLPGLNHAAIGEAWRHAGQYEHARQVWERAGEFLSDRGRLQLAGLYRHLGEWSRAEAIWLRLHARGNASAALALSKYYEHRKRDFGKAIEFAGYCERAEREPRFSRLRDKIGGNLQLPLMMSTD